MSVVTSQRLAARIGQPYNSNNKGKTNDAVGRNKDIMKMSTVWRKSLEQFHKKKMTFSGKEHIAVTSDEQMIMSDKHLTSILFKVITAGDFALECL